MDNDGQDLGLFLDVEKSGQVWFESFFEPAGAVLRVVVYGGVNNYAPLPEPISQTIYWDEADCGGQAYVDAGGSPLLVLPGLWWLRGKRRRSRAEPDSGFHSL